MQDDEQYIWYRCTYACIISIISTSPKSYIRIYTNITYLYMLYICSANSSARAIRSTAQRPALGTAQNQLFVCSCTFTQPSCVATWGRSLVVNTHQYQFPPGSKNERNPPNIPRARSDLLLNGLLLILSSICLKSAVIQLPRPAASQPLDPYAS